MGELRYDPLAGHWVNIAALRALRPNEFQRVEFRRPEAVCPFCAGHETQTPPPVLEWRARDLSPDAPTADDDRWLVRVVPNKYPAFEPGPNPAPRAAGPYAQTPAVGIHEIVIESPRHVDGYGELNDQELALTWRAYQQRIVEAHRMESVRQAILFKNCRPEAGASLEHAHSQLVGSPVLTDAQQARWERCAAHHQSGRSLLQSQVDFEVSAGERLVANRGDFVAYCPFASRFAYQVRLAARGPIGRFESLSTADLADVGMLVRDVTGALESVLSHLPYNAILHLPPRVAQPDPSEIFPWFIDLVPRLNRWAGWELADGGWINDCPPEFAAAQLRGESSEGARGD